MKLSASHIRDLTEPRFKGDIREDKEYIIDTHCHPHVKRPYDGKHLHKTVDVLNATYHNAVARYLGFDVNLGYSMRRINRDRW